MRLFKFLARLVLAITLAGVAAKANAQSIDELYQAAKKEGALSLNGGGLAGLYEPWVQEFEQRFPSIKVKLTADFSNILAPINDREIAERKLSVDLTIFQTLQDYALNHPICDVLCTNCAPKAFVARPSVPTSVRQVG